MAHRPRAGRLKKFAFAYFFALHKKPTELGAELSFQPRFNERKPNVCFGPSL
jgi:hypothetical protein